MPAFLIPPMRQGSLCERALKKDWHKRSWHDARDATQLVVSLALVSLLFLPSTLFADELLGVKPLLSVRSTALQAQVSPDTHVLIEASAIEAFLRRLDGEPPDWAALYGHGHHDPGYDERLFNLNRERDAKREGNDALHWRIAFLWSGELSGYDSESGGFSVALGPMFTPTSWGMVRFKYDDLFGNLVAVPTSSQRENLFQRIERGELIQIEVVMMGRLISEESIIYDFSHEQEGMGVIMPVVRIEEMVYLLAP